MAPPPVFHAPERPPEMPCVNHRPAAERLPRDADSLVYLVDRQPFERGHVRRRNERVSQRTAPFSLNINQPPGATTDIQIVLPFARIVASSAGSAFALPVRSKCAIKSLNL